MRSVILLSLASALLAGCNEAPVAAEPVQMTWEELNEMVEAFGYEQGIRRFCEDPTATGQDEFLAELETMSGFDETLLSRAQQRAAEVQAEFDEADPNEDREYVCTVEMFVGSEGRADIARETWADLKGIGK